MERVFTLIAVISCCQVATAQQSGPGFVNGKYRPTGYHAAPPQPDRPLATTATPRPSPGASATRSSKRSENHAQFDSLYADGKSCNSPALASAYFLKAVALIPSDVDEREWLAKVGAPGIYRELATALAGRKDYKQALVYYIKALAQVDARSSSVELKKLKDAIDSGLGVKDASPAPPEPASDVPAYCCLNWPPDGMAKYTYNDRSVYVGEYQGGNRSGHGVYTKSNGEKWEGEWSKDYRSGYGKEYDAAGKLVRDGYWDGDRYLGARPSQ